MLDPSLVPSPLVTASEHEPIQIVPVKRQTRFETLLLVPVSYSLAEEGVERLKNFRRARRTGAIETSA